MGDLSYTDAIGELQNLIDTQTASISQIRDIVSRLNLTPPEGATIVLYTGNFDGDKINDPFSGSVRNNDLATELTKMVNAQVGENTFHMIDKTIAGDVFKSVEFKNAMTAAGFAPGTIEFDEIMGGYGAYTAPESIWGIASYNYASDASGNVITFTNTGTPDRIFGSMELKALMENEAVISIDGIDKAALQTDINVLIGGGMTEAEAYAEIADRISDKSLSNTFSNIKIGHCQSNFAAQTRPFRANR